MHYFSDEASNISTCTSASAESKITSSATGDSQFRSGLALSNGNSSQTVSTDVQPSPHSGSAISNTGYPISAYNYGPYNNVFPYTNQMSYWHNAFHPAFTGDRNN